MELPPKICPRCGEEYVHTAVRCADCDVALGSEGPREEVALELPPAEELVALRYAEVPWIEGLYQALAEEGIPSRIELPRREDGRVQQAGTGGVRCTILVRPEDRDAAARIDGVFARTQVPDLPDDAESWQESDTCPACGDPLSSDSGECAGCGLNLGSEE